MYFRELERHLRKVCILAAASLSPLAWAGDANAYTLKTLYSFCSQGCAAGKAPMGDVTIDSSGNIFGTTAFGGDKNEGVVFELVYSAANSSWTYQRLYSFCTKANCRDGAQPRGHLIIDRDGSLYGTTQNGGGGGVIYKLDNTATGWKYRTLHAFCAQTDCTDGSYPYSGLTYEGQLSGKLYDGHSPLYGTTPEGGAGTNGSGVVYEIARSGNDWNQSVVYNFCSLANCADGAFPQASLTFDKQGHLLSTTGGGGANSGGTIFELANTGGAWTESVLYSFCSQTNCADGRLPTELTFASNGQIYGTTVDGGISNSNNVSSTGWTRKPAPSHITSFTISVRRRIARTEELRWPASSGMPPAICSERHCMGARGATIQMTRAAERFSK
jgi:uncharacterized repeat protein (TIGR03803 family)